VKLDTRLMQVACLRKIQARAIKIQKLKQSPGDQKKKGMSEWETGEIYFCNQLFQ